MTLAWLDLVEDAVRQHPNARSAADARRGMPATARSRCVAAVLFTRAPEERRGPPAVGSPGPGTANTVHVSSGPANRNRTHIIAGWRAPIRSPNSSTPSSARRRTRWTRRPSSSPRRIPRGVHQPASCCCAEPIARGFVFFTNYNSRKGRELTDNPQAALCFYWSSLDEQIRIEGRVERVSDDESDAYFAGRPRGSQLGAWASDQSQVLSSRETLEERVPRNRTPIRWPIRSEAAVLGRLPSDSFAHRVLVRTPGSSSRSRRLRARGERLAHRASLSVKYVA